MDAKEQRRLRAKAIVTISLAVVMLIAFTWSMSVFVAGEYMKATFLLLLAGFLRWIDNT